MLIENNQELPPTMITPLDNRKEIKNFNIKECFSMSSKKVPLWLTCKNI